MIYIFSIFENCCRSGIFLGVQFQTIDKFRLARTHPRQSFHFQKSTGTLNINIYFFILKIFIKLSNTSKNNRQKENLKFNFFLIFAPTWGIYFYFKLQHFFNLLAVNLATYLRKNYSDYILANIGHIYKI